MSKRKNIKKDSRLREIEGITIDTVTNLVQDGTMSVQKRIYYGTITALDEQVGRLWSKLEALGIQDDTIIWFCSDNGPEKGTPGSAGVYREIKRSLYEGGVRVPAFMIWQNNIEGGNSLDFPAVTSDYFTHDTRYS